MDKTIKKIRKAIENTEFEGKVYLVGGYVRDKLMKRKDTTDIDIVVELCNGGERLANFLHKQGLSSQPKIYKRFGTAQIRMDSCVIEMVMTRNESYRQNTRNPEVNHASLKEDIFRRDFTVNSLAVNLSSSKILDLTDKGRRDIKAGKIRAVSEPDKIFSEDPLRMLRAVRFAVKLGFEIEKNTESGIKNNYYRVKILAKERIRDEFIKMLRSPEPARAIRLLKNYKILELIFPEFKKIYDMKQNKYHYEDVFEHSLSVIKKMPNDLVLRLAALFHDIGKGRTKTEEKGKVHFYKHEKISAEITTDCLKRIKINKKNIKNINRIIKNHMILKPYSNDLKELKDKKVRKIMMNLSDVLEDTLILIDADNNSHADKYRKPDQINNFKERMDKIREKQKFKLNLPVTGYDIMKFFQIKEGKVVGEYLEKAKNIYLENPNLNKDEILAILKEKKQNKE